MHAQDQNSLCGLRRLIRSISARPARPLPWKEIDDDHVGDVTQKAPVAGSDVLRLDDPFNANVLKDAPAALQQNRMIVDNSNTSGHGAETPRPTFAQQSHLAAGSILTVVP